MIEYYPQIRMVHISAVVASGAVFALRGVLRLAGSHQSHHPLLRYGSYAIETLPLTAALMLLSVLRIHPGNQPWLAVKLLLLVTYVVLGSYALKRAHTVRMQRAAFLAAVVVFLYMVGVARAHHPLGPLAGWL